MMPIAGESFFSSETVIILGAGASNPYGFPLGSQLKQVMQNKLTDRQTRKTLTSIGFEEDIILKFHEALRYSYHPTVDLFLENKTRFRDIGSYIIALSLIPFENNDYLFPHRDWYEVLFNTLGIEFGGMFDSYPSFISLNYDRSLEHFLNKNIEYNCKDEKLELCYKAEKQIKIVHAHGSLGAYPDMPYGLDATDPTVVKKAAERIKIVSDVLEESPDFREAKEVILQASNVVFFGFGYDTITLKKLLSKSDINSKNLMGTGIGLSDDKINHLYNEFGDKLNIRNNLSCKALLLEMFGAYRPRDDQ